MEQIELTASKREVLGKKVRFLRRQGIIPANLFGHGVDSVSLQCNASQFQKVIIRAGMTRLINLKVDDEDKPRSVMIREIQRDPVTGAFLHADLYQVRMTEKITVEVPVALVGEALAIRAQGYTLVHEMDTLNIETLPGNIPDRIEIDVSSLTEPDQSIHVKDIKLGEGITILTEPDVVVVRVSAPTIEKVEEKAVEAPTEEEAKAEAEEAAGGKEVKEEAKAEAKGESKKETKKETKKE